MEEFGTGLNLLMTQQKKQVIELEAIKGFVGRVEGIKYI